MQNLLCGPCAQKSTLELPKRIELANARKLDVEYLCPGCGKVHAWTLPQVETVASAAEETEETGVNEEKPEVYIQGRLF